MIADIGTKALTSTHLELLKVLLGTERIPTEAVESGEDQGEEGREGGEKKEEMRKATAVHLLVLANVLAAQMLLSKAAEVEGVEMMKENLKDEKERTLEVMVFFYTMVVIVVTLLVQRMWKVGVRWMEEGPRKPSDSKARSLAGSDQVDEDEEKKGE